MHLDVLMLRGGLAPSRQVAQAHGPPVAGRVGVWAGGGLHEPYRHLRCYLGAAVSGHTTTGTQAFQSLS
ncbi:hypothetical protein CHLRE_25g756497v5 [Chlamydomonas reinhardtii]|uniref:Uncharacterized protein n=1 Tax=Chlamydomonas reinhardtii TaxID=3055 RepID=A0A2K3CN40_CHLRE|nr:uncharacterized protein CHLRE_25g756497v5 [Chlamydomonas reinhardtii]PNW69685.1 hypothetical protein CHLRE_25g756497v5 [Chlamydomonas reinhardtii]